jgi:hypothetical protein
VCSSDLAFADKQGEIGIYGGLSKPTANLQQTYIKTTPKHHQNYTEKVVRKQ